MMAPLTFIGLVIVALFGFQVAEHYYKTERTTLTALAATVGILSLVGAVVILLAWGAA